MSSGDMRASSSRPSRTVRASASSKGDAEAFKGRTLADADYVYCRVDKIHLKVRLEQDKVCLLVLIGVRATVPRNWSRCPLGSVNPANRGPTCSAAASDGGCLPSVMERWVWKALREVSPDTLEQRCWFHALGNVLAALPKSAHPGAKAALADICNAEDREHALEAAKAFADLYGTKWPKALTPPAGATARQRAGAAARRTTNLGLYGFRGWPAVRGTAWSGYQAMVASVDHYAPSAPGATPRPPEQSACSPAISPPTSSAPPGPCSPTPDLTPTSKTRNYQPPGTPYTHRPTESAAARLTRQVDPRTSHLMQSLTGSARSRSVVTKRTGSPRPVHDRLGRPPKCIRAGRW